MNDELDKYYELLGVSPGASARELKDAYRDLAKVWHPDRFSHDPRLQQKAQEKLKEINEAYALLTSGNAGRRTRPAPAPAEPHAPAPAAVRRRRPRPILITAAVFCAVFFAAFTSLVPRGTSPAPDTTKAAVREEAQPSLKGLQPEGGARNAAGQTARDKERSGRQPAAEASSGDAGAGPGATQLRPMPTVTVRIDAVTGQLATQDCPIVSTMTFPAGGEPRQHCTAQHKTKGDAQGSRLKSVGKRLAAPLKWLGGEKGAGAVETRDAQPSGGDGSQNR
ncbi:MAG TPA: J domain-containing protein [Pyrinomonadaceae bacterium]